MSGAPGTEGGPGWPPGSTKRRCDLSAPSPGGPALSARVRSLLAACPSWRTRFSAPRMHLLAPRALGAKLHAYCLNSRSEENFIRNTSIFGAWNTAYSMEYVEYGWNTAEYRPLGGHLEYVENVFRQ